jgi:hypothetical protein
MVALTVVLVRQFLQGRVLHVIFLVAFIRTGWLKAAGI